MKLNLNFFGKGETEAFLGLFFDGFSKIIGAIGILKHVFNMPDEILFSRILPGIAMATIFGNIAYFLEAQHLRKKECRDDVTAQPYGIGAGQIFSWIFLIIGPVYWKTGSALLAWQVSLAAGFIGGMIEILGAFMGKLVLRMIPKSALMGNLAGAALVWLALLGMFQSFSNEKLGLIPLLIGLLLYFGKDKISLNISPGVVCLVLGIVIVMSRGHYNLVEIKESIDKIGFYLPKSALTDIVSGMSHIKDYLPIIIPLQITNFITTLQGIESAAESGDKYPVKTSMVLDGIGTLVGSFFGNPFPTTVFYGHPTWKKLGARSGYVLINAFFYMIIGFTGISALIALIIPFEIVVPILIFLGLSVGIQCFTSYDKKYIPAALVAFIPIIAQYIIMAIEALLNLVNSNLTLQQLMEMEYSTFPFRGIIFLSNGAFLLSILYGTLIHSFIDMDLKKSGYTFTMLFFSSAAGLIHSPKVEFLNRITNYTTYTYALLGVSFLILAYFFEKKEKKSNEKSSHILYEGNN